MEHIQLDSDYYSCDFPNCKKTRSKLKHNIMRMPEGWHRTVEIETGLYKII